MPRKVPPFSLQLVALAASSLALLLLHVLARTPVPAYARVIGSLPGVAALVLWWRYFLKEELRFPFLEYAVTQFYVSWAMPSVTMRAVDLPVVGDRSLAWAVLGGCVVTASALLAYPIGKGLGLPLARGLERLLPRTAPAPTPLVIYPLLAVAVVAHAGLGARFLPPDAQFFVSTLVSYVPLLMAIAWRDLAGGGRWSWSFAVSTAALSAAGMLTGMMEEVLQPVLAGTVLYVVFRRRVPWRLLIAGALIVVIINPAKHHYREMAWWDDAGLREDVATDPVLAAERWWKAIQAVWNSDSSERASLASRLDELSLNAVCFEQAPGIIPFDRGKGWAQLPAAFVPRFLYPDKPNLTAQSNDRFSITFGFQTREETENSTAAFPLVADGYWNFGWPGIVFAGLVAGLLIGLFSGAFQATSWAMASIAVASLIGLHANGSLNQQILGVVQRIAGMGIACWVVWLASRAVQGRRKPLGSGFSRQPVASA